MKDIDQEVAFTQNWWRRCTSDESKLVAWLQKLQITEVMGYYDWEKFDQRFNRDDRTSRIIQNIGMDEMKHSNLLLDLFQDRGIQPAKHSRETTSLYWEAMYKEITDLETCCAVNYYGEALAAFRFEVIQAMPETPSDIKYFLDKALPDEQFHRETLMRLAGDEALEKVKATHLVAKIALLGLK